MRLIDIEDISLIKTIKDGGLSTKALWRRINKQPTVNAVPVIQCKDCKYYCGICTNDYVNNNLEPLGLDGGAEFMPDETFYCAMGEK